VNQQLQPGTYVTDGLVAQHAVGDDLDVVADELAGAGGEVEDVEVVEDLGVASPL